MAEKPKAPSRPDPSALRFPLSGENQIEATEQTLHIWASILADAGRDHEAADALRVAATLLGLRCSFLESEKAP